MIIFDMRTVILLSGITYVICTLFIVQLWWQNRRRFAGIAFWVFNLALQTAAAALIVLRGTIPDWMSIVLANTLVFAGAVLVYIGLERFVAKVGAQLHNYTLFALCTGAFAYLSLVHPDLRLRTLITSMGLLIIAFQCLWLLLRRVGPDLRPVTFWVGMVFGGYCVGSIVRILEYFLAAQAGSDYYQSGASQTMGVVFYQMLFILLTYSLVLMVNKRLLMEIGKQEAKFAKAFHSAPYAILLTRPSDGVVVDVNEGFVAITGYDRGEAIGRSTMDLHVWEREEDRAAVLDALSKNGKVHGMELRFRTKNGETVTGLFFAEIILVNGEEIILSSIGDITKRKEAEEEVKASLKEKEVLLKEIHHRVKNNLQIVSSLLYLQSAKTEHPEAVSALKESRARVRSMALIHERLYQSRNLASVDMGKYTRNLVSDLQHSYRAEDSSVRLALTVDDISFGITEAIPCGLIINELVSNALKHAFPKERAGELTIQLQRGNTNHVALTVSDNGIGFPEHVDFRKSPSLGLTLVNSLVEQLNGTIELDRRFGTAFTITFAVSG